MAQSYGVHPRRVRADLEKSGRLSELRLQILENKTVRFLLDSAKISQTDSDRANEPDKKQEKTTAGDAGKSAAKVNKE